MAASCVGRGGRRGASAPSGARGWRAFARSSVRRCPRCWHAERRLRLSRATLDRHRVAVVIERSFGVRYSRDHVSRCCAAVAGAASSRSRGPPSATRPDHRVARALAHAQKRADEQGATIVWVDESGFSLLPLAVLTWAPRGQPRSCMCPSPVTISPPSAPSCPSTQLVVRLLASGETATHLTNRMSPAEKARIRHGRAHLLRRHGVTPRVE